MSRMLSLTPYASWITTTPGNGPWPSGTARKPPPFSSLVLMSRACIFCSESHEMVAAAGGRPKSGGYPLGCPIGSATWARGAVGSASEWHSEGQGFESPRVHQRPTDGHSGVFAPALKFPLDDFRAGATLRQLHSRHAHRV